MRSLFRIVFIVLFFISSLAVAQDSVEKKEELPASGRLAGSSVSGYGYTGFEGAWGGENLTGENASPISASVKRQDKQNWLVRVFNNSEDEYKLNLLIEQKDDTSKRLKSNPLSVSLKAGESFERTIRAHVLAAHATVNLSRWSKIEKELTQAELMALIEEKKAEIEKLEAKLSAKTAQ